MTIAQATVERALVLLARGADNVEYFFEQLTSPEWIAPLAAAKLFSSPSGAIRVGELVSLPLWSAGGYLARMARISSAQPEVLAILKTLPESDNPRIYEVIAKAANALPPAMAEELVPQLLRGAVLPIQILLPESIASVVVHLANGGRSHGSLKLARALLAIVPPPEVDDDAPVMHFVREARSRFDVWEYGRALDHIVGPLVRGTQLDGLALFCDLLKQAIEFGAPSKGPGATDYSYIWRPVVDSPDSQHESIRNLLVSAVRDASLQVVEANLGNLDASLQRLQVYPYHIFRRLALHLLLCQGEASPKLVDTMLAKPGDWAEVGLQPEYELLLAKSFGRLPPEQQKAFLDWIERGPNETRYIEFRRDFDGQDPSPAEVKRHRDIWVRDHLGVLRAFLSPANVEQLATLEQAGPARQVGKPPYRMTTTWQGDRSPLTELEALELDWLTLIDRVRNWTSVHTHEFDGPSPEGMARSLRQRVVAKPQEAVLHLSAVADLDPRYTAAVLEGLGQAVKDGQTLDWPTILTFVDQVVRQAGATTTDHQRWRWVSKCAASLLREAFDAPGGAVLPTSRDSVWSILESLCENPDPTPADEDRFGGTNMDPATLSLNTVRGDALHAAVRYGLWWRRHVESQPDGRTRIGLGLEEQPELKGVFERHLIVSKEPSLAVRAVYGQWFPWIHLLDPHWAESHISAIFPEDQNAVDWFWAAWGTYVVLCPPFTTMLPVLRAVYKRAIRSAAAGMTHTVALSERPSEHLGQHLLTYYWRGELTLDDTDLIAEFFSGTQAHLRGAALEWVGRALVRDKSISPEATERLQSLWNWRRASLAMEPEEMRPYGWWYSSGQFDEGWAFGELQSLLDAKVLPEPSHLVMERLAHVATTSPLKSLDALERMIGLAAEGWAAYSWLENMRQILRIGLRSSDSQAATQAERMVHRLGALGHRELRSLLRELAEEGPTVATESGE